MVLLAAEPNPRPTAGVESSVAVAEPTHECLVDLSCRRRRPERNEIAGTKIGDDPARRRRPPVIGCRAHDPAHGRTRVGSRPKLDLDEWLPSERPDLGARPLAFARKHRL